MKKKVQINYLTVIMRPFDGPQRRRSKYAEINKRRAGRNNFRCKYGRINQLRCLSSLIDLNNRARCFQWFYYHYYYFVIIKYKIIIRETPGEGPPPRCAICVSRSFRWLSPTNGFLRFRLSCVTCIIWYVRFFFLPALNAIFYSSQHGRPRVTISLYFVLTRRLNGPRVQTINNYRFAIIRPRPLPRQRLMRFP